MYAVVDFVFYLSCRVFMNVVECMSDVRVMLVSVCCFLMEIVKHFKLLVGLVCYKKLCIVPADG